MAGRKKKPDTGDHNPLDAVLERSLKVHEKRWAADAVSPPTASKPAASSELAQLVLPFFDEAHVLPNALARSCLFAPRSTKESRRLLEQQEIYATGGLKITFSGPEFDQSDLDVLFAVLDVGAEQQTPFGTKVRFRAYDALKRMGQRPGGRQYTALWSALLRLNQGTIAIQFGSKKFFGSLLEGGVGDDESDEYVVKLNEELGTLFGFDTWSQVDRAYRRALGRNYTAKHLHAFYSTHVDPGPHRYSTLANLSGLKAPPKSAKRTLVQAHKALEEVGFLKSYEAGPETISVVKAGSTASQVRNSSRRKPGGIRRRRNQI